MPVDGIKQKHESFGMLQFSRIQRGGSTALFGSSIEHQHTIAMRLHTGVVERGLNTDWYFADKQLFEIEMSQTQFAEAISSMNMGSGVPVTIRYIGGKRMEDCPFENKRQQFEQEFKKEMREIAARLSKLTEDAERILKEKKAPTKADKEIILGQIAKLRGEIGGTMPFIQSCFNEQMDKTVLEAKGEVDAFVTGMVTKLGLESLQQLAEIGGVRSGQKELEERTYREIEEGRS